MKISSAKLFFLPVLVVERRYMEHDAVETKDVGGGACRLHRILHTSNHHGTNPGEGHNSILVAGKDCEDGVVDHPNTQRMTVGGRRSSTPLVVAREGGMNSPCRNLYLPDCRSCLALQ